MFCTLVLVAAALGQPAAPTRVVEKGGPDKAFVMKHPPGFDTERPWQVQSLTSSKTHVAGISAWVVQVWDVESGTSIRFAEAEQNGKGGLSWSCEQAAFSPSGKLIAVGCGDNQQVRVYDAATGKETARFTADEKGESRGICRGITWSGEKIVGATFTSGHLHCFDLEAKKIVVTKKLRCRWKYSGDTEEKEIDARPTTILSLTVNDGVIEEAMVKSENPSLLLRLSKDRLDQLDIDNYAPAAMTDGRTGKVYFVRAQGRFELTDKLALHEAGVKESIGQLIPIDGGLIPAAISPDLRWVAVGGKDGYIRLHDVKTGKVVMERKYSGPCYGVDKKGDPEYLRMGPMEIIFAGGYLWACGDDPTGVKGWKLPK